MKQLLLVLVCLFTICTTQAQTIGIQPKIYNLPCGVTCTNFNFKVPDYRSTEEYIGKTIAFTPSDYTSPLGNELTNLYNDDEYSPICNLPFTASFYGVNYTQFTVGSNGLLTFDVATNSAPCKNAYPISFPLPYAGGSSCSIAPSYYPKASIMGCYTDLEPSTNLCPPDRKIEWRIDGTAPLRKAVTTFYNVGMYGNGTYASGTSCNAQNPNTFQMTIEESTGIINVFIKNKICNATGSGQFAILGIQNFTRDKFVAAPGKNQTLWSAVNEGFQFKPSGATPLFQNAFIKKLDGTLVGNCIVGGSGNDSINLSYNNYCVTGAGPDTLVVTANYNSCTGLPADEFSLTDTLIVKLNPGNLLPTATKTDASCTAANGTITVNLPPGGGTGPFMYQINGGAFQASNIFTGLTAGTYTLFVKDATGTCTGTIMVTILSSNNATVSGTTTATSCAGVSNGTITVTTTNTTAPIQYSINGGANQASNIFTGLAAGSYTILVTDANGCIKSATFTVSNGAGITALVTQTATSCAGVSNGQITVTNPTGTAPHTYAIDGGAFGVPNIFIGLASGAHTIIVKDNNGCTGTYNVNVTNGAGITATATQTATSCAGVSNGQITVTNPTGTAPHTYAIDGGAFGVPNIFTGLASGGHVIIVKDANGCTGTYNVLVANGAGITATATQTATSCAGVSNGQITVTNPTGTAPHTYAIDGGAYGIPNIFTGLASGAHTVKVKDANGCTGTYNVTVLSGAGITANVNTTATSCPGASNGTVTVSNPTGTAPHTYAIDGGAYGVSNIITNLASGPHTVNVKDANGCTYSVAINIAAGAGISVLSNVIGTSCNGASNGSITAITSGGNTPYNYSINGGTPQVGNTFVGLLAGNYVVIVNDVNNCSATVNLTVPQGVNLAATTTLTQVACNGTSTGAATINNTNGNPNYTYSLNGGTFQPTNTFSSLPAGNYTVALKDANNCTGTVTFTITEPTLLVNNTAATPVLCNGSNTGSITINGNGGVLPYTYSINGTTYITTNNFAVAAGTYTAYVKDANGCIKTSTVTVIQPTAVTLTASATSATCNGGADGVITATANGGTAPITYSIDGTVFQASNTFNVLAGNYTVLARDANNCTKVFAITVTQASNILLSTRTDTTICESKTVVLTTSSNATSFVWHPGSSLNDSTLQNPTAAPTDSTMYVVTATLGFCSKMDTVIVKVNKAPIPDAGLGTTICFGKNYQLQGSGGLTYTWTPTATLNNPTLPNPTATPPTTTTYYLNVLDNKGCASLVKDSATIVITPPIVAYAGPDTTIVMGQPYQLNATGASIFSWSPAFGLSNPNIGNPIATIFAEQLYNVEVSTIEGCKGNATVNLKVYAGPTIYIPTIFTPNNDGKNDVLTLVTVGIKQFVYMRIYNRWGQLIFSTNNPKLTWDGTYKGVPQPTGAYIYNIKGVTDKDKTLDFKGTVLIER